MTGRSAQEEKLYSNGYFFFKYQKKITIKKTHVQLRSELSFFLLASSPLKDDEAAMDFVTAAANIRSRVFNIATKSRFDIKSMAGNIIPAIATTNAIIAALIVMESLKILMGNIEKCNTVSRAATPSGHLGTFAFRHLSQ